MRASSLQLNNTAHPSMSGRNTSSEIARGENPGQDQRVRAARGDQDLEPDVPREIREDARVVGIVLHDEQHGIVGRGIRRSSVGCGGVSSGPRVSRPRRLSSRSATLAPLVVARAGPT